MQKRRVEWTQGMEDVFPSVKLEEPAEGWREARNAYAEWVYWADRMDGWDMLTAT
jgi:hypothetical protein